MDMVLDLRRRPGFKGKTIFSNLSEAEIEKIKESRADGKTFTEIGKIYEVSGVAVRHWFNKNNWPSDIPKMSRTRIHLGYRWIYIKNRGLIAIHRLIMEGLIGRKLNSEEIVHHKDGNKLNNNINNLDLIGSISEHMKHHNPGARGMICNSCKLPAFTIATKQGNLPRCRKCFNHLRRYHLTGFCSAKRKCAMQNAG